MIVWFVGALALCLASTSQGSLFNSAKIGRYGGRSNFGSFGFGGQRGYSSGFGRQRDYSSGFGSVRYGGIPNITPPPPSYQSSYGLGGSLSGNAGTSYNSYGSLGQSYGGLGSSSLSSGLGGLGSSFLSSSYGGLGSSSLSSGIGSSSSSFGLNTLANSGKSSFGHGHGHGHGHGQGHGIDIGHGHTISFGHGHGHGNGHGRGHGQGHGHGYGHKVHVPVHVHKHKKKQKIITINRGMFSAGGTQMYGKFKTLHDCEKACGISPNCFAGDFDPWGHKCYGHSNITACNSLSTHPSIIHFKKIPCSLPETPRGLITLGAQIFKGLEQKGIKDLKTCIKKCATAGGGIAPVTTAINSTPQICFGIDYDFGSHKCYFHTNSGLCPTGTIVTPEQQVAKASSISILLCPTTSG